MEYSQRWRELNSMVLPKLKKIARNMDLRGYSTKSKMEIIDMILLSEGKEKYSRYQKY